MNKFSFGDMVLAFSSFVLIVLLLSFFVSTIMYVEYMKHPNYADSDIFAQGQMQKSTDCYGITTVKIGSRVVDVSVTIPTSSGFYESVKLPDLCADKEFTVYKKSFWLLGNAYTIK